MTFGPGAQLRGTAAVPGDKSISHRALMLAALAVGRSRIEGLCDGADVASTAAALRTMGARVERCDDGAWRVDGVGVGGLLQPRAALDLGNSGTAARLLTGLIATHPITATLTGDASLGRRPMERVAAPLRRSGADIVTAPGGTLPLVVRGLCPAVPLTTRIEIPSAQLKSALLFAALNSPGLTRVVETVATRDHGERLLRLFGAEIAVDGGEIALRGEAELRATAVDVPGDFSAAAFLIVAASVVPGSELRIHGVGINKRRTGLLRVLEEMGADIRIEKEEERSGEPVAGLVVRHAPLRACAIPAQEAADMIDEFPAFFVAAAFARGRSSATGIAELRLKESDRIAAMAEGLTAIGARVEESEHGLSIEGSGGAPLAGGAAVSSRLDHRVAMSLAVAGLNCRDPIAVDDMAPVATGFPGFAATLKQLAE